MDEQVEERERDMDGPVSCDEGDGGEALEHGRSNSLQ